MRYLLVFAFVFIAYTNAKSCGWYPEEDNYYFHNIFYQTNISEEAYYPFMRHNGGVFHEIYWERRDTMPGNVKLWQQVLPNWGMDDINAALITENNSKFQAFWKGKLSSDTHREAKTYMEFARDCSSGFNRSRRKSWDYNDILKTEHPDYAEFLEKGFKGYQKTKNAQLKTRYAYQIIRLFHYSGEHQSAIDFFNKNVKGKTPVNEMYYYCLDQVAGCYYSLEDYEKAAYYFLQVFSNSWDRKASAFISYRFCTDNGATGKSHFQGKGDKVNHLVMQGLRSFSDEMKVLNKIMEIAPNDERLELLFARAMNDLEREAWPKWVGMKTDKTLPHTEGGLATRLRGLRQLADAMRQKSTVKNQAFWNLSAAYLAFLQSDYSQSNQILDSVKNKRFKEQTQAIKHLNKVFQWSFVGEQEEVFLAEILDDAIDGEENYWGYNIKLGWKSLIVDRVAHVYYKNNHLGKAFLMHNRIESIREINSIELINDILTLAEKKSKNRFEKILMRNASFKDEDYSGTDYMNLVKGVYYLKKGDPQAAKEFLKQPKSKKDYCSDMGKHISALIFSNNTKECFSCEEQEVMVDSVFMTGVFSFILPTFTKEDLANYLVKLEGITQTGKKWEQKLAHYLIANYYFNISNTGYYRGALTGDSNCCNYYFVNNMKYSPRKEAAELIKNKEGYNLQMISMHDDTYHNTQATAFSHYQQVIELSTDKELNARCLYMMAKCELNDYYNNGEFGDSYFYEYEGAVNDDTKPYKRSFKALKRDYKDTKFYKNIIKECSFFKYYCSL